MVLIIDDEQALQEVITEILELSDIPVLCAGSGEEGFALFAEHHGRIDAIFLDMQLPGMGGSATFNELRKVDATIPIVIMSGHAESATMAEFNGQEHLSYLAKPFTLDTLMAKVGTYVNVSH